MPPKSTTQIGLILILVLCAANRSGVAAPVELTPYVLTLPGTTGEPMFVDIEGNGKCHLLVLDLVENTLLNYQQHNGGFVGAADQVIPLPSQTAWVAACDVDPHPGLELVFSTVSGIFYSRQDGGLFEKDRRVLIDKKQASLNFDSPILTDLKTNKVQDHLCIPVFSAEKPAFYSRNAANDWIPEAPLVLNSCQMNCTSNGAPWWEDRWGAGQKPAHFLLAEQFFSTNADAKAEKQPEDALIAALAGQMSKAHSRAPVRSVHVDINGDGREDLAMWQVSGKLDLKSDIYIFLRGADGKLPERPTQILHCRGFPIPGRSTVAQTPFIDLKGDGVCELVLLELKMNITSYSEAVKMALTRGLDLGLTIRTMHDGLFSHSPDATIQARGLLPSEALESWPFFIQGDFNGDGRPDILFKRSETRWEIYLSTTDGSWFEVEPSFAFATPGNGYPEIKDLTGDGRSDIIWHEWEEGRLSIYTPPAPRERSTKR